ncbi:hypothetical protein SC206_19990 [Rouxiella sp. T17]|uniref:hypothetical protein n=1 Tax=Rouxiella sp. T17 TaxID=3085684 RepID=UPI002FCA5180
MTEPMFDRLNAIHPLSPADAEAVLPTVIDWAIRAASLSDFVNANLSADVVPITVFISPVVTTK